MSLRVQMVSILTLADYAGKCFLSSKVMATRTPFRMDVSSIWERDSPDIQTTTHMRSLRKRLGIGHRMLV